MFGNLKSKIGDVADLKKLTSPQALASIAGGSRQRSSQHTPGSITPRSRHSRQASTASLQGLGLPSSPPRSPTDSVDVAINHERVQELEREVVKLRSALETQQDAALERLNAREQEWKAKLQSEKNKLNALEGNLGVIQSREKELQEKMEAFSLSKRQAADQLKEAQARVKGLEAKVIDLQDDCDQMEGLNSQEMAKIKHMLLNANGELEGLKVELKEKKEALFNAESRLNTVASIEDRVRSLSEEKTELEGQVTGLNHRLSALNSRYTSLEDTKNEETKHLQERISTLEQRHSQGTLQETDKVQALMKERETMEHRMEEARQQLNNIKSSWSEKITALENQIQNLNSKTAEDQMDLKRTEQHNSALEAELSALKEKLLSVETEKSEMEKHLSTEISCLKEAVESLQWQITNTSSEKDKQIAALHTKLKEEQEKHKMCSHKLKTTEENYSSLEGSYKNQENELRHLKTEFETVQTSLQSMQRENISLQDTINSERTKCEQLEKTKLEIQLKLDTVTSEKSKLSLNLDEYVEKLSSSEDHSKSLEEESQSRCLQIQQLEDRLSVTETEREELRTQLQNSEHDLQHKIEESDTVKTLRETIKGLEDELSEKKQALKVQGQRLADMKKTIQRELKLTADTTDHMTEIRPELRPPRNTSPPLHGLTSMNGTIIEDDVNHTYLKHVIIKYLTSREYEAIHLTRAVATLLHMTPEEERLLQETLEWKMSWFGSKPNLGKGQNAKTIPPSQ